VPEIIDAFKKDAKFPDQLFDEFRKAIALPFCGYARGARSVQQNEI